MLDCAETLNERLHQELNSLRLLSILMEVEDLTDKLRLKTSKV